VKRLADGVITAQQSNEALGEVAVVGQRPDAGAIAVDYYRLAAAHAFDDRPAAVRRYQRAVVGV
jgi:hypothetical protein